MLPGMSNPPTAFAEDVIGLPLRAQLETFLDEHRAMLTESLDGLTEEQARRRLVTSATTLLGLLKHVTWMQRVWFEQCVGGTSRRELGLVASVDESFLLADDDTVASVTAAHRQACKTARAMVAGMSLDTVVTGSPSSRVNGPDVRSAPLWARSMPSAWHRRAGPRARSRSLGRERLDLATSTPATTSPARRSTALGVPSGPVTTLQQWCMP